MTTLPQTSAIRLPRTSPVPSVGSALATAGPTPMAAGAQMTGSDIWRVIRSHLWLILALVGAAGAGGYVLNKYLLDNYPTYTATGHLQVQTQVVVDPVRRIYAGMDAAQLSAEQRTQAAMLRSEALIAALFRKVESQMRGTEWFAQFKEGSQYNIQKAKEDLLKCLTVAPIPESKLIKVQLKGSYPKSCQVILTELVDLHLDTRKTATAEQQNEQRNVLDSLVNSYQQRKESDENKLRAIQEKMRTDGFLRSGDGSHRDLLEIELLQLMEQLPKLQELAGDAKSRYESFLRDIQDGRTPAMVENLVRREEPRVNALQQYISNMKLELNALKREYGDEHRYVKQQQAKIEEAQAEYDRVWADSVATYRKLLESTYKDTFEQTQKAYQTQIEKVDAARRQVANFNAQMVNLLQAQAELKLSRELHRQASDQLKDITIIQDPQNASRVTWIERPETPEIPTFPKLWMTLTAAIIVGLGLGLGIAFLREMTNTKVRTPRDIARVGPMNVLGIIPDDSEDPEAANTVLPLVIFSAPHSMTAEQFRQVRTRLQHSAALDTTRSIMVTGPAPEDGKTTVSCNLAAGLALNGRKILLVDANFRRPELHRIFKVSNDQGFGGVLDGSSHFDDVVHETQVPNLSVMPAGPKPPNATELFESQLLVDFIERALEEYDHVIFDTGPLLVVSESVAMAPRVDGVVTVVRAHRDSRGLLSRMREALRQVKAEHLGVVLNAVRSQKGGYYSGAIKAYYRYQSNEA